jgi:hypothetical protein
MMWRREGPGSGQGLEGGGWAELSEGGPGPMHFAGLDEQCMGEKANLGWGWFYIDGIENGVGKNCIIPYNIAREANTRRKPSPN